jgi:hypothetical protein
MKPAVDTKVIEWPNASIWIDAEGIVCLNSKRVVRTLDETKGVIEELKRIANGKKICLLVDLSNSSETPKEIREYAASEFPKFIKAAALISDSALGKMIANLFFNFRFQPYPSKMFNSETEAKKWLRQFCQQKDNLS